MTTDIEIDREVCLGYGVCAQSAPTVFQIDDDGDPVLLLSEVDADHYAAADLAIRACPTGAIQLHQH